MTPPQRRPAPQPAAGAAWELSDTDLYLFNEGTHRGLADKLGAHSLGPAGTAFAVWAPSARSVSVVGDFNGWDRAARPPRPRGARRASGRASMPTPPRATSTSTPSPPPAEPSSRRPIPSPSPPSAPLGPDRSSGTSTTTGATASGWRPGTDGRRSMLPSRSTRSISARGGGRPTTPTAFLGYEEMAPLLIDHVLRTGFTHVEFLPVMEHPFYGSLGLPDHRLLRAHRPLRDARRTSWR